MLSQGRESTAIHFKLFEFVFCKFLEYVDISFLCFVKMFVCAYEKGGRYVVADVGLKLAEGYGRILMTCQCKVSLKQGC